MSAFSAELIGTMILVILGDGVVANVLLNKSKGQNAGWIVITVGWGLAVMMAAYAVGTVSGAHLNPAVTVALAAIGKFETAKVPTYIAAQMIGAFLGAVIVWLSYLPHWKETPDQGLKLGVFCTAPGIRHTVGNLICEIVGTAMLLFGALSIPAANNLSAQLGFATGMGPMLVGLLIISIGVSLGGPTGYSLNPARDLAPRIAHAILPIAGKGGSDWGYAWIPVVGPFIGALVGAFAYKLVF